MYLLWPLGGNGGASSIPCSDQEFLSCAEPEPSVGVGREWRKSILGEGGFVSERSRECVGFGGLGSSQLSVESLQETLQDILYQIIHITNIIVHNYSSIVFRCLYFY